MLRPSGGTLSNVRAELENPHPRRFYSAANEVQQPHQAAYLPYQVSALPARPPAPS